MKISIITACRNSASTVRRTMESVLAQENVDYEHIVVDGASTDGTAEVVRAYARPGLTVVSEPDNGLYDALNKGIRLATGDVVGILNADDVFEDETTLARVVAAFDDATDAVSADIRFVKDGRTTRYYSGRGWRPWMARWGFMVPHPGVYLRRELFARFGDYRTDYRISADFELMLRYFCVHGVRRKYLPGPVVQMSPGGLSTSGLKAMLLLNRENVRANRENGRFSCLPMMLPKYLYKILGVIWTKGTKK